MGILEWFGNAIIFIINTIIWLFASVLNLILGLLPNSPFLQISRAYDLSIAKYMPYLSWLLPIKEIIAITVAWLSCMMLYYVYSVVMRWIKLID